MSHTRKVLKEIASSVEYEALMTATKQADYEAMFSNYGRILERLKEGKETVGKNIENLPVRDRQKHQGKFSHAFELAIERILPVWHQLDQQLKSDLANGGVMDGEVFGFGRKGDPLVRTPEGTIVVLQGSKLKEGEQVMFRVVHQREKINFGMVFELNPRSFYLIMTQQAQEKIKNTLGWVEERLGSFPEQWNEGQLSESGDLLQRLEEVERLSSALQAVDRDRIVAQVLKHRKRLLYGAGTSMMFEFISRQEEKDIENFYQDGCEEKAEALLAMGLFRRHTYEMAKEQLFSGGNAGGYEAILGEMGNKVDSMDAAMKLMEFKSAMDEVYPKARKYFAKMDHLFEILVERSKQIADVLSSRGAVTPEEIRLAIEKAFSEEALFFELRQVFRGSKEFLSLRSAFAEVNRRLGNQKTVSSESAFSPYLRHKVLQVFSREM